MKSKQKKTLYKAYKTFAAVAALLPCLISYSFAEAAHSQSDESIKNAIVKIYASHSSPDYRTPWKISGPSSVSGSGCIISGNRILTNAHVVSDATFIEARLHGQSKRYKAHVLVIAHEVDLAILTVDDDSFFADIVPLELGTLPEAQQEVLVYGFPIGGDALSVTKGILSRIEHQAYVYSDITFLAGQIDAAINPGNSGGPVIVGGHIAGVVMQSYSPIHSENLGYMIPSPIIEHFFKDIEDGRQDGFPAIGIVTQNIENPDMKRKYKMSETQSGVIINHIHYNSPARGRIKVDDILMKVDGHPVSDFGTAEFRPKERTFYSYFIEMHQMGETVELEILRNGKIKQVSIKLENTKNDFLLVKNMFDEKQPRYFIFGGLVFSPLTKNLISQLGSRWRRRAPDDLLMALSDWPSKDRREVVLLLQVLASDLNRGYHDMRYWIISEVNGKKFGDFNEFSRRVLAAKDPFIVFKNDKGVQIVIDRKKAEASARKILETYRIKDDRSPDLKDL